jgi:hypothetical protein
VLYGKFYVLSTGGNQLEAGDPPSNRWMIGDRSLARRGENGKFGVR